MFFLKIPARILNTVRYVEWQPARRSAGPSLQQASAKENGVVNALAASNKVKLKIKLGKQAADTEEAKRKAIYNGLGLDDFSDDEPSLDDDDDNYSRSNVESPEPSPMAMIEVRLSCSLCSNKMGSGFGQTHHA